MGKGLATITRSEIREYIAKKYNLPGAEIKNISYDYEMDTVKLAVEHERIKNTIFDTGFPLPRLEVPAQSMTPKQIQLAGISDSIKLLDQQYEGCKKPVDPEFYHLVRNIAKYLLEEEEQEQARTLTMEQLRQKYDIQNCQYK